MRTPQRRQFKSFKKARGFSLIEFGIVATLLAIAAMVVYGFYQARKDSGIASETAQAFTMMAADSQQKFSAQGNYTGATAQVLINNGVVPATMVSGNNIQTRWNTQVTVAPATLTNANDALQFTIPLPAKACSDFVTQAQASAARVSVGGTVVKNLSAGVNTVNIGSLGTACDATGGGEVDVALIVTR